MQTMKSLVYIDINLIHPHPDNPRKNLGDLSELTESIRKNGVMQNLTVMSIENEPGQYRALIGHRRLSAAKQAGIDRVPCKIVSDLTLKEQVSIMLEENMQRNDLTIYEQAQGFQMMLDLGDTEETIAKKTGFSKSTIYHRLNLAKLDPKLMKEKQEDTGFQMTLSDMYALEQIKDIDVRNKVLEKAKSSRDLVWSAKQAAEDIKRKENAASIIDMLKAAGCSEAPKEYEKNRYSGKWVTEDIISLDKDTPTQLEELDYPNLYYCKNFNTIAIIRRKKESEETSEEEIRREKRDNKNNQIKEITLDMKRQRERFVTDIISGIIPPLKDETYVMKRLWSMMADSRCFVNKHEIAAYMVHNQWYAMNDGQRASALEMYENHETWEQMLLVACKNAGNSEFINWDGSYNEESGKLVTDFTDLLEEYGFSYRDEEQYKIMHGTHELYEEG